jgi:hypothetical protein
MASKAADEDLLDYEEEEETAVDKAADGEVSPPRSALACLS